MSSHQDWNPVVFNLKNKQTPKNKPTPDETTVTLKKHHFTTNLQKFDGDDIITPKKLNLSLSKQIQQARTNQKMTQKQLAVKINERVEVVRDYENGKAIPSQQIINKLRRVLNAPLKV